MPFKGTEMWYGYFIVLKFICFPLQLRNLAFKKIPQKSSHGGCLPQHEQTSHGSVQKDSQEENWQEWRQRDEQVIKLATLNILLQVLRIVLDKTWLET